MFGFSRRLFSTQTKFLQNKQVRLNKRPRGLIATDTWKFTEEQISLQPMGEGDIIVKVSLVSIDPAMRGWLNEGKSYVPPVQVNEVMRAIAFGQVLSSNNPKFNVGDSVTGLFGVQQYATLSPAEIKRAGVTKTKVTSNETTAVVESSTLTSVSTGSQWLNVLGMPGMTGYFGLKDVGRAKAGETIVVSAASGAVGQTVGQLAKIYGLRVVGIAGGKAKCDYVVNILGFDACIDYKASESSVRIGLKEFCPNGIDIFFDNVGGDILDTVLTRINRKARIVVCGAISQYNNEAVVGPKNYLSLLVNRASMEGMVVFDYTDRYHIAVQEMNEYLSSGKMKSKEDLVKGIERFPEALNMLFTGRNFGKLVLKVNE